MRRLARTDLLLDLDLLVLTERLSFLEGPRDSGEPAIGEGARLRSFSLAGSPVVFVGVPVEGDEGL